MTENPWPRLRLANNKDCGKVTELVYNVLKEYNLRPDPAATDIDIKDIEQSYLKRGGAFYVLEEKNGSIVGAYGLYPVRELKGAASNGVYPIDKATCELRKMYLHSSYRGKGLGKLLLEDALLKARQIGFKRMTLETASVLKEAISLYKSYGFIEYEPEHLSSRCDQAFMLELKI